MVHTGTTLLTVLSSITGYKNIWVVDYSAMDHITRFRELFSEFSPYFEHTRVQVANNTYAQVMVSRTGVILEFIVLRNVLYVPNIQCNLLCVKCIACQLNCLAILNKFHCVFLGFSLGKDD